MRQQDAALQRSRVQADMHFHPAVRLQAHMCTDRAHDRVQVDSVEHMARREHPHTCCGGSTRLLVAAAASRASRWKTGSAQELRASCTSAPAPATPPRQLGCQNAIVAAALLPAARGVPTSSVQHAEVSAEHIKALQRSACVSSTEALRSCGLACWPRL